MAYINFQPKDFFDTKLWTGNDTAQTITGIPFAPDFVWIKNRSAAESHTLVNTVIGANNFLKSNANSANNTNSEFLKSFTSDGYTLGSADEVNNASNNIVGWNWKAGTTGSGTTGGSGTGKPYSYSVNTTSGFSIVTYTGNGSAGHTIPHGLGVAPKFIIVKSDSDNYNWTVYYGDPTDYLVLNAGDATTDSNEVWNDTAPTSTVFTVGNRNSTNQNTATFVAYCFTDITGFSKAGLYNGSGATTGAFVYTGFKPAFVMTKIATTGGNDTGGWVMVDNKRYPNNLSNSPILFGNLTNAEETSYNCEFFSNGFRFNASSVTVNGAGNSYAFLAFAEEPLVASNGQPATAR